MESQNRQSVIEAHEILEEERRLAYAQKEKDEEALNGLEASLCYLRSAKPDERSELTRRYAVTITDFEKVVAYFRVYVTGDA